MGDSNTNNVNEGNLIPYIVITEHLTITKARHSETPSAQKATPTCRIILHKVL